MVRFTDVTEAAGLNFIQARGGCGLYYFVEQVASGAAIFDANGDGHLDIYFPQPKPLGQCAWKYTTPLHHRLYINDGTGKFTLKPDAFGGRDTDYGIGAAVGDYDNDGHPDLYVACYGKNTLFHNRGDGTFEDVTERAGVAVGGFSTGAVWFDYDGDGLLDLFVCRYCEWTVATDLKCLTQDGRRGVCDPKMYTPALDVLFHNNGDGTFTDVTHKAGIGQVRRRGLGVAAADFNGDGKLDVFVANDLGPNFLYINQGNGTFKDVAIQEGTAFGLKVQYQANMGVAVGDYDEDGDLDIVITTFSNEPFTLYRNDGDAFSDQSISSGLFEPTLPFLGFGTGFIDARNIGRLDLFFADGHVNPFVEADAQTQPYKQRNLLMLNDGAGRFVEATSALPADDIRVHRGACFGDINNDGRIDILVTASDDRPTLLRNDSPQSNWLILKLITAKGCATAIGARAVATFGDKRRMRVVLGGGSYGGESDHRIHFGLGGARNIETLEIHWMSGAKQILSNVAANQILTVREAAS